MSVLIDRPAPGVARILINRSAARNALDTVVREGLLEAVTEAGQDSAIRALVIGGADGMFCAGGDLPSLATLDEPAAYARLRAGHRFVSLLWSFPKPVIAAVERFAIGAGAGLALLADEVVIGEGARIGIPFARLGLVLDWGLAGTLPRRIGAEATLRLYADAAMVAAPDALAMGLVDRVVADDAVMTAAIARAEALAKLSPAAFASAKARQRGDAEDALQLEREAREQAKCIASADFVEGYAAFKEKREPRF
jgi:2-(1,2-epoxy-1,2-dihydrophenyl)acetyl-CoA isomerase